MDETRTPQELEFLNSMKGLALEVKITQVEHDIWLAILPTLTDEVTDPGIVLVALLNVMRQFITAAPPRAMPLCLDLIHSGMRGLCEDIERKKRR